MTGNAELHANLVAMAGGDRTAFAAFYRSLEKPVYRFILSKMNDPHESPTYSTSVFMDVWRSAGKFEGRSTVKTWVFGIAYRKTMDYFRRTSRTDVTDEIAEMVDDRPDGEACLLAAQNAAHVRFCLDELKPGHKAAVEMAFFEDMTYGEIAGAAGVPEGTIKTRIFHAKKLLLHCLEGRLKGVRP